MNEKIKLTSEQKQKIWKAIAACTCSDDINPQEVIARDYDGDEERYLLRMAKWHNVSLD